MAMTAEQLEAAIDTVVQGIADGIQQIRYPDGSSITHVDAAQAPSRLKMLRAELATVRGLPTRTRIIMQPTMIRRF